MVKMAELSLGEAWFTIEIGKALQMLEGTSAFALQTAWLTT
jgi:hypothetical protein